MVWPLVKLAKPSLRGPSRVRETKTHVPAQEDALFYSVVCMNGNAFLHHINLFNKQLGAAFVLI